MTFDELCNAAMRKRAALGKRAVSVLTPEASAPQPGMAPGMAAGGMPPQGMPPQGGMDPGMAAGGMPPQGMSPQGGMPPQGGQLPPEILQDAGFIQWLAAQGVMLDQASGTFVDQQSGQMLPPDMIMQGYQAYMQEMQGGQAGMPPQAMPPQGGMDPGMAAGGMPPQGMPPQGGQIPPEILQDAVFSQFLQEMLGIVQDPSTGMFIDPNSQQPLSPDELMQIYALFQQQASGQGMMQPGMDQGMMQPGMDQGMMQPGMDQGMMQPGMDQGMMQPGMDQGMGADSDAGVLPPELLKQIQSVVDAAIDNYTAMLDKKLETLMDKLDAVKQAVESMRDTDDMRSDMDRSNAATVRDEIASELNPVPKTASVVRMPADHGSAVAVTLDPVPVNIFELLRSDML